MGVGDWLRRQFVSFQRRNLLEDRVRRQAIEDAVDICRQRRARFEKGSIPFEETDSIFDELLDAFDEQGLDPEEVWRAADQAFPDNPRWLESLASRSVANGKTDRPTFEILRRQAERSPDNLPLILRLIECYRAQDDAFMETQLAVRARVLAKQYLDTPEGEPLPPGVTRSLCRALYEDFSKRLAAAYLDLGRRDAEAMELYEWMLQRDITETAYLEIVAGRYLEERRMDDWAIEIFESAVAFNPENRDLQRFLALHYLTCERENEGLSILRKLARSTPPDEEAANHLIQRLRSRPEIWCEGDLDLIYERARRAPVDSTLLSTLANYLYGKGDVSERAREIYRLAADNNIESGMYLRKLADHAGQCRDLKTQAQLIEEIARREGAYSPDLLAPLAEAYAKQNRRDDQALEIYRAALEAGSRNPAVHEILCRHYYEQREKSEAAIEQFRQTLEVVPECVWAQLGLLETHIAAGRHSVALTDGLALLKKQPDNERIRELVARAVAHEPNPRVIAMLGNLGDTMKRELLWAAFQEKPSARPVAVALARAEIAAGSRDKRLIPILRTALHAEPEDPEIAAALSEILWRSGREAEAVELDQEMLGWASPATRRLAASGAAPPRDDREVAARQAATRLSGFFARGNDTSPAAIKALWRAFELGVCSQEAIVFLARHTVASETWNRRALDLLNEAVRIQPQDLMLRAALMKARAANGEGAEALRWGIEQLRKSPARKSCRQFLSELLCVLTKADIPPQELGQMRALCSANPDDVEIAQLAARAHQIAGVNSPQVRSIYERALAGGQSPNPALMLNLARSCQQAGETEKAIQLYSAIVDIEPENIEALDQLASLYAATRRRGPKVMRVIAEARRRRPQDPQLKLYHADLLLERGEYAEGFDFLQETVRSAPALEPAALTILESHARLDRHLDPPRAFELAKFLLRAGRPGEAIPALKAALESGAVPPAAILEALETVETAAAAAPLRLLKGRALKLTERFDEALVVLEPLLDETDATQEPATEVIDILRRKLSRESPPTAATLMKLGRFLSLASEFEEAIAVYTRALQLDPENEAAKLALAGACLILERYDQAMAILENCPPGEERSHYLVNLSLNQERGSQWEKALRSLQLAAEGIELPAEENRRLAQLEARCRQERAAREVRSILNGFGETTRQRYEILQEIHSGHSGSVFRAYDRKRDEVVAFRLFPQAIAAQEAARALLEKRMEALRAVSHPLLIKLHDAFLDPAGCYVTQELIAGGDLGTRMSRIKGPLPVTEVRRLAQNLSEALAALHAAQIVHGALRPSRVLSSLDGAFKLTGFFAATLRKIAVETGNPELLGLLQTSPYTPPEQSHGQSPTSASDVFAFGAILYHAVVGTPPGASSPLTPSPSATQSRPAIQRAGPALSSVILRCLQADPDRRYPSFEIIRDSLKSL